MSIQQVIHSLDSLYEVHQEMLGISKTKQGAIVNNDVEKLIEVMNQESRCVKQIEQLEANRVKACQDFLIEKGIKSQLQLTVTELTRIAFDPSDKKALQDVQSRLSQTLNELKTLNELNQKLIEQSLGFIDYSLGLLGGRDDQEVTYQHPAGKSGGVKKPGLFDTRA